MLSHRIFYLVFLALFFGILKIGLSAPISTCGTFYSIKPSFTSNLPYWQLSLKSQNRFRWIFRKQDYLKMLDLNNFNNSMSKDDFYRISGYVYQKLVDKFSDVFDSEIASQKWVEQAIFQDEFYQFIKEQELKDPNFFYFFKNKMKFLFRWQPTKFISSLATIHIPDIQPPIDLVANAKELDTTILKSQISKAYVDSGQRLRVRIRSALMALSMSALTISSVIGLDSSYNQATETVNNEKVKQLGNHLDTLDKGIDELDKVLEARGFYK